MATVAKMGLIQAEGVSMPAEVASAMAEVALGQGVAEAITVAGMLLAEVVALERRRHKELGVQVADMVLDREVLAATLSVEAGIIRKGSPAVQQAVVAAVTAATKAVEPTIAPVSHVVVQNGERGQQKGVPGAAPASSQLPSEVGQGTQVLEEPTKGKECEVQGAQKKKKEDKAGCFRCKKPGYHIDDCPTPFCDLCESIHHITSACHLLNAPKPNAILHGYANEALMFFELACGAFKAKAENPKLAKVTVEGATMTIPELIEQLKKIVPSEKFNWEVFHFRDNIYRVKLPSKLEVQRLKNFGTYLCTDREAALSFDLWSSVEEPLYTLPEVWVRVTGLPSDIRSDYLSLWGVGTLFGKTLDVDMAYTRKNKVLRTKIGCLDRTLIPPHSEMFIRRGFYKLFFEVEPNNGSQEVNMAEAHNGDDGHDDANNGEDSHDGGNAMDMDPNGVDEGNKSDNVDKEETNEKSEVEGMQVQSNLVDAIQIGTMKISISPKDSVARGSISRLPQVSAVEVTAASPLAVSPLSAQLSGAVGPQVELSTAAGQPRGDSTQGDRPTAVLPPNGVHQTGASVGRMAQAGGQCSSGGTPET
ncbi:hypothetical protein QYE76_021929 [Lolium multiflorum]|uniref:DUF4283 domain-containing protein n=1 Tax=Lolium multiflorum TaxID=4521 RepID=A0AAD8VQN3_LOLMU|nr:hypothetical protein QYE76_021929 [Lolium multiflorum]